jgi:hypothetical protein
MPGFVPGIHAFCLYTHRGVDGIRNSRLRELRKFDARSRVNPTSGDKPGHDGLQRCCNARV